MKDPILSSLIPNNHDDRLVSKQHSKSTHDDLLFNGETTTVDETSSTVDTSVTSRDHNWVIKPLVHDGFAFVEGSVMESILQEDGLAHWDEFASSWNDMPQDNYMADGGRYRRRRYALLQVTPQLIIHLPTQPFRQSKENNPLNGGVDRWYDPISDEVIDGPAMQGILSRCRTWFSELSPNVDAWYVDIHQFRIEASGEGIGKPTPEGIHRDGADWVLVYMIKRHNIEGGVTTIYDNDRHSLTDVTLIEPLDVAVLDDRRVLHSVTPVTAKDPDQVAYRDVLIINFREKDTLC